MIKKCKVFMILLLLIISLSGCNIDKKHDLDKAADKSKSLDNSSEINPEGTVPDSILEDEAELISEDYSDEYSLEIIPESQHHIGEPAGICIYNDTLVVCDKKNNSLVLLDKACNFIQTIGALGMGPLEFTKPTGITVYNDKLYVLDSGNRRIQILDSDYNYVDEIALDRLVHEEIWSEYIDLAVDTNGIIYVSTIATLPNDAHIFRIEDKMSEKLEQQFIGHLFSYNGTVYAANSMEIRREGNSQSAGNGKNSLYRIDDKELIKIRDLPYEYKPLGICFYDNKIYTVSGFWHCLDIFSMEGELEQPVIKFPDYIWDLYLTVYDDSLIYCTTVALPGKESVPSIYKITKAKD